MAMLCSVITLLSVEFGKSWPDWFRFPNIFFKNLDDEIDNILPFKGQEFEFWVMVVNVGTRMTFWPKIDDNLFVEIDNFKILEVE